MRKDLGIIILMLFCLISVSGYSQEKLFYNLYYWMNPKHKITTYNKILLVSNASNQAKEYMRHNAKKAKYKVILYDDLFPAYKKWTSKEVDSVIISERFDAYLTANIKNIDTYQTSFGGTSFIQPKYNNSSVMLSHSTTTTNVGSTQLEMFLIDNNTADNEYVIFISGWVGGNPMDAAHKSMYNLLKRFEKLGISYPSLN